MEKFVLKPLKTLLMLRGTSYYSYVFTRKTFFYFILKLYSNPKFIAIKANVFRKLLKDLKIFAKKQVMLGQALN